MTDNEIIKALECCDKGGSCELCPYFRSEGFSCVTHFNKDVLDLINRQQAEVSELQHRNSELEAELDDLKRDDLPRCKDALRRANEIGMALEKENQELKEENDRWKSIMETVAKCASEARQIAAKHARSEAVREFAERLIARCGAPHWCVWMGEISEEMEEMVGEENEVV
jgi:FtsZ-binding cell division protein ZapB